MTCEPEPLDQQNFFLFLVAGFVLQLLPHYGVGPGEEREPGMGLAADVVRRIPDGVADGPPAAEVLPRLFPLRGLVEVLPQLLLEPGRHPVPSRRRFE